MQNLDHLVTGRAALAAKTVALIADSLATQRRSVPPAGAWWRVVVGEVAVIGWQGGTSITVEGAESAACAQIEAVVAQRVAAVQPQVEQQFAPIRAFLKRYPGLARNPLVYRPAPEQTVAYWHALGHLLRATGELDSVGVALLVDQCMTLPANRHDLASWFDQALSCSMTGMRDEQQRHRAAIMVAAG